MTALHLTSEKDHQGTVKLLFEEKAEIEQKPIMARHLCIFSSEKRPPENCPDLLEYKANIKSKDEFAHTALHLASKNGHQKTVIKPKSWLN